MITPITYECWDFCQHPYHKTSYTEGSLGIFGKNAAGKSNLFRAGQLFAWTGMTEKNITLEQLIRYGAAAAKTRVVFDKDGLRYTLDRQIPTKASLVSRDGAGVEVLKITGAEKANKAMTELLGCPGQVFMDLVTGSQLSFFGPLLQTNSERRQSLQRTLGLDSAGMLNTQVQVAMNELPAYTPVDAELAQVNAELGSLKSTSEELEAAIVTCASNAGVAVKQAAAGCGVPVVAEDLLKGNGVFAIEQINPELNRYVVLLDNWNREYKDTFDVTTAQERYKVSLDKLKTQTRELNQAIAELQAKQPNASDYAMRSAWVERERAQLAVDAAQEQVREKKSGIRVLSGLPEAEKAYQAALAEQQALEQEQKKLALSRPTADDYAKQTAWNASQSCEENRLIHVQRREKYEAALAALPALDLVKKKIEALQQKLHLLEARTTLAEAGKCPLLSCSCPVVASEDVSKLKDKGLEYTAAFNALQETQAAITAAVAGRDSESEQEKFCAMSRDSYSYAEDKPEQALLRIQEWVDIKGDSVAALNQNKVEAAAKTTTDRHGHVVMLQQEYANAKQALELATKTQADARALLLTKNTKPDQAIQDKINAWDTGFCAAALDTLNRKLPEQVKAEREAQQALDQWAPCKHMAAASRGILTQLKEYLGQLLSVHADLQRKLLAAQADIKAKSQLREHYLEQQKIAARIEPLRKLLTRLRDVFHWANLPSLVLKDMLVRLNSCMSWQLRKLNATFELKLSDEFDLQVHRAGGLIETVYRLSGAETDKGAIAYRLAQHSFVDCQLPLLVLDEPTTGLDADGVLALADTLEELSRTMHKGMYLHVITHEPRLAPAMDATVRLGTGTEIKE